MELAEEKTKVLEFGRYAETNSRMKNGGNPETFDFLGFTFYCSMDSHRKFFRCKVKTSKKKFRSKIKKMNVWIKNNRTLPYDTLFKRLNQKLKGHYQYYGVTDNIWELQKFYNLTVQLVFKWLNRRSQKKSYTAEGFFNGLLLNYPLAKPVIMVSLIV